MQLKLASTLQLESPPWINSASSSSERSDSCASIRPSLARNFSTSPPFVEPLRAYFRSPMASYVPSFTSHYVGSKSSKSSKQVLMGRFRNAQAGRIRVGTLSTFIFKLCTLACGIIMFNMFNAITCSRSRTASFVGSSCRCPRPLSSPSQISRITSTESALTINWTSDSDFGILIGTSTAPVSLRP